MPYLKFDDGKLAAHISKTEGIDQQAAENMIAKFIREIQSQLDKGDSFDIFEFGSFFKNAAGEIEFKTDYANQKKTESVEAVAPFESQAPEIEPVVDAFVETPVETEAIEEKPEEKEVEEVKEEPKEEVKPEKEKKKKKEKKEKKSKKKDSDSAADSKDLIDSMLSATSVVEEVKEEPEPTFEVENTIDEKPLEAPVVEETPELVSDEAKEEVVEEKPVQDEPKAAAPVINKKEEAKAKKEAEKKAKADAKIAAKEAKKSSKVSEDGKKPKKKRGFAFWMLTVLLLSIVGGAVWAVLNFETVKEHIPFLQEKKEFISPMDTSENLKVLKELNEVSEEDEMVNEPVDTDSSDVEMDDQATETEVVEEPAVIEEPKAVEKPKTEAPKVEAGASGTFHIIVGASGSQENANKLVEKLKSEGYQAVIAGTSSGGLMRISAGLCSSRTEANELLEKVKGEYPKAWLKKN